MVARKKKPEDDVLTEIIQIKRNHVHCYILGTTPLIMNRMPKKAWEQLLLPPRRRNKAQLEATLKHDPVAEFRNSVYTCREASAPTYIHLPNNAFKKAVAQAAVDIPGVSRAAIGRLVSVASPTVFLYGRPFLYMAIVRPPQQAPDVRTRAIFPQWACKLELGYISTLITERNILSLLAAAGNIVGVGDNRTEKGSGDFGQWEVVSAGNPEWEKIVKTQGRAAQEAAMQECVPHDADTEELLGWFKKEVRAREQEPVSMLPDDDDDDDDVEVVLTAAKPRNGRSKPAGDR